MKQGKLEMVKQEMARVNIKILGINELNGLECQQKSLKYSAWMQSQK